MTLHSPYNRHTSIGQEEGKNGKTNVAHTQFSLCLCSSIHVQKSTIDLACREEKDRITRSSWRREIKAHRN